MNKITPIFRFLTRLAALTTIALALGMLNPGQPRASGPGLTNLAFQPPGLAEARAPLQASQLNAFKTVSPTSLESPNETATVTLTVDGPEAPPNPPFPLAVMLVLDGSETMGDPPEDSSAFQRKFDFAIHVAEELVDGGGVDQWGLVLFAGDVDVVEPLTSNPQDVKMAIEDLAALHTPSGTTPLADAIDAAQGQLEQNPDIGHAVNAIIVLSDGIETSGNAEAAANEAKAKGTEIIALSFGDDLGGKNLMQFGIATNCNFNPCQYTYDHEPPDSDLSNFTQELNDFAAGITAIDIRVREVLENELDLLPASVNPPPLSISQDGQGNHIIIWEVPQMTIFQNAEFPGEREFSFDIRVDECGKFPVDVTPDSKVTYTDSEGNEQEAFFPAKSITQAFCAADLSLTKSDDPDPATAGFPLAYVLEVTNDGPQDATGVTVTDVLPNEVDFAFNFPLGIDCDEANGTVTCNFGDLAKNSSVEVRLIVVVPSSTAHGTILTNNASVSATEPDFDDNDNSATEKTTVIRQADLDITKSDSPDPVSPGDELTYTLEVSNDGYSDASQVTLTDVLPAEVTFVSATPATCLETNGIVTCDLETLVKDDTATVTIVTTVDLEAVGEICNIASVAANEFDDDFSNNSVTECTKIQTTAIELTSFKAEAGTDDVTLTWETAAEIDNEGFNLWRSQAADGEYAKINPSLIPAQGNADTGASYEYVDTNVVKGVAYYYKLEDVDFNGVSTFHGPVSATPSLVRRIYLPLVVK